MSVLLLLLGFIITKTRPKRFRALKALMFLNIFRALRGTEVKKIAFLFRHLTI